MADQAVNKALLRYKYKRIYAFTTASIRLTYYTQLCQYLRLIYTTYILHLTPIFSWSAGGNAKLRYQITSGNTGGVFDVEPEVGTIFIAQPLDYEQNKR